MLKKVLIVAYYWPPAGGPGVQRWLKFVKYLPDFGIEPIVFVPENASYPIVDESLNAEIPSAATVIKFPIKEPYKLAGFLSKSSKNISKGIIPDKKKQSLIQQMMLYIRGNFFIPDARIGWVKPSVSFLETYCSEHKIDMLITTGPPHSLHLIGLHLKEKRSLKWIADFRDPWTSIDYHKELKLSKASENKHKALEKQVLTKADQIVVTSESTRLEFEHITSKPIEVITNGYDTVQATNLPLDNKFSMAHIGSLLSERNPEILWRVLKKIVEENQDFEENLEVNLVGVVSESVLKSIANNNLIKYVNNVGYVSHNESVKYQKKSQVLLLIESNLQEKSSIIPGKLFEYMVSNRPILAIGPRPWDVSTILANTNTGTTFSYEDEDALQSKIIEYFEAFKSGTLQSHGIGLQKYSRKALTEHLVKLL